MITGLIQKLKPWSGRLLALWFVSVVILSVIPSPRSVQSLDIGKLEIRLDYLYHIIIYATGSFLALLYSSTLTLSFTTLRHYVFTSLIAILLIAVLAVGQEYIQKLIPYRSFNINDILSNLIGVVIGSGITLWCIRKMRMAHGAWGMEKRH